MHQETERKREKYWRFWLERVPRGSDQTNHRKAVRDDLSLATSGSRLPHHHPTLSSTEQPACTVLLLASIEKMTMFCALFLRPTLAKNSITHICMHVQDIYASSNAIHIIIFWRARLLIIVLIIFWRTHFLESTYMHV